MQALGIIALTFLVLGLAVLVICALVLRAIFTKHDTSPLEDETRLVQDMYRTLNKLEERIGVLETVLEERRNT